MTAFAYPTVAILLLGGLALAGGSIAGLSFPTSPPRPAPHTGHPTPATPIGLKTAGISTI